jgi:hypothetical protein
MPPVALQPPIIELGKLVLETIKQGGLKTLPIPLPMGQPQRPLAQPKTKVTDEAKQRKRVLKLSDAAKCVEDAVNDPRLVAKIAQGVLQNLWREMNNQYDDVLPILDGIAHAIVECMEKKVLSQAKPRTEELKSVWTRKP